MRRRSWLLALLLGGGVLAGLLLAGRRLDGAGSSLSRGATGWLATRFYLERRGDAPAMLEGPIAEAGTGTGTLVIAFPWQSRTFEADTSALEEQLSRGGDVVLAYAGETVPSPAETALLAAVGVDFEPLPVPPLSPLRWRRAMGEPWRLRPAARWESALGGSAAPPAELQLRPPRWLPELSREDALLLGPGDRVVAAAWRQRAGRVVVLPAELLCNARLYEPAHAALLETLRAGLAIPWRFDESHHGLGGEGATAAAAPAVKRGFDLLLLQLLLVYAMAVLALARRLGPAWREASPLAGSAGGFLLRLGALHHRLGHHGDGAALLLRRAGELDRRLRVDAGLASLAERGDAASLVEVGQAVARLQRR